MGLVVYRASAGSGKTFKLVENYFRFLWNDPSNYRHVLAVTFTNKATAEMKQRILEELDKLARKQPSAYFNGENPYEIAEKARQALQGILHDYSHFYVSTIDSFFQRVIRSFLRELSLELDFQLEVDGTAILDESVSRLFMDATPDSLLGQWLVDFVDREMEEDRSWKIEQQIVQLGEKLFTEKYKQIASDIERGLGNKEILKSFKESLEHFYFSFKEEMGKKADKALEIIHKAGLSKENFKGKSRSFVSYFDKIKEGKYEPTRSARDALNNIEKWGDDKTVREIYGELNEVLKETIAYYDQHWKRYHSYQIILKNIGAFGILLDLAGKIKEYKEETRTLLLSDSTVLLWHIIQGAEAPFIYEKAGTFIHSFMIDEFQDTSHFQWMNFRPLLINSLSEGNSCYIVGDVKQSIYRWRNSDWNIMASVLPQDNDIRPKEYIQLDKNYRSPENIVQFNNAFFSQAASFLATQYDIPEFPHDKNLIKNIYSDTVQQRISKKKGYVQFTFVQGENKKETEDKILGKLPDLFKILQDKGYAARDTAILVRKNDEAKQIADYLLRYKRENINENCWDVISDEAIMLSSSYAVCFVTEALQYFIQPSDIVKSTLGVMYKNYLSKSPIDITHEDFAGSFSRFETSVKPVLEEIMKKNYSLVETVEEIIFRFDLQSDKSQLPFLYAFHDRVLDFSLHHSSDPSSFMKWWNNVSDKLTITLNPEMDAVRILTIHKAKGLEFKNVIIPFCMWEFQPGYSQANILWVNTENRGDELLTSYSENIPYVPVAFNAMKDSYFEKEYYQERYMNDIDNLNLMYVAFTRPKENLFVFTKKSKKEINHISTASEIVCKFFDDEKNIENFQKEDNGDFFSYTVGELMHAEILSGERQKTVMEGSSLSRKSMFQPKPLQRYSYREFFISGGKRDLSPVNKGLLMHRLLSEMNTCDDIPRVIQSLVAEGLLEAEEKEILIRDLTAKINGLPQIRSWFSNQWERVRIESAILTPEGLLYRPDRVMINGNSVCAVDYKFGEITSDAHRRQMQRYLALITEMGYEEVKGFLWYYSLNRIDEVEMN